MKNQIINSISKLSTVGFLVAAISGSLFAYPVSKTNFRNPLNAVKSRAQHLINPKESPGLPIPGGKGQIVGLENQKAFNIGSYIVRVRYDSVFDEEANSDYLQTIEHGEVLVGLLNGEPEEGAARNLLNAVNDGEVDSDQILEELVGIYESYSSRQSGERKWYFQYGAWNSRLACDTYSDDSEVILDDIDRLYDLYDFAPDGIAEEILKPLEVLAEIDDKVEITSDDRDSIRYMIEMIDYLVNS